MAGKQCPALDKSVSYEDLYGTYHSQVLKRCRLLLVDPHEAEEVAQEVFLKMYQKYRDPVQTLPMAWAPWLTQVSVNACRDRRRSGWFKWWGSNNEEFREIDYSSTNHTPEEALISKEKQESIWRSFQVLSQRQKEVFVLRHLEGLSTEEVAELLGMTMGSVKRHLFRAVRHLRISLGKNV